MLNKVQSEKEFLSQHISKYEDIVINTNTVRLEQKSIYKTLDKASQSLNDILLKKLPKFTGELIKNTEAFITQKSENKYAVTISTLNYFDFLNEGVNGKMVYRGSRFSYKDKKPPISELMDWAKSHGINVYALQNSIYNKGLKPRHFLTDDKLNDVVNKLADELAEAEANRILNNL